jgi:hypothetical protein
VTEPPTQPAHARVPWPIVTAAAAVAVVALVVLLVGRRRASPAGDQGPLQPVALVNEVATRSTPAAAPPSP